MEVVECLCLRQMPSKWRVGDWEWKRQMGSSSRDWDWARNREGKYGCGWC